MITSAEWKRLDDLGVTDLFEFYADSLEVFRSPITPHHYAVWYADGVKMVRVIARDAQRWYHYPEADAPYSHVFPGNSFPV